MRGVSCPVIYSVPVLSALHRNAPKINNVLRYAGGIETVDAKYGFLSDFVGGRYRYY